MKIKKTIALFVVLVMTASLVFGSFAAYGAAHFGSDTEGDDEYYPEKQGEEETNETDESDNDDTSINIPSRSIIALTEKREKNSEDTTKVINSYGLNANDAKFLIARHKDAEKGKGNREKVERYERILKANPYDYLAAYRLAQANFAMGRNSQAIRWVNQCLEIFPNYRPAQKLRTKLGSK